MEDHPAAVGKRPPRTRRPGAPAPRLTIEGDARMKPINLAAKLGTFHEPWQPRTVGTFNGHDLMVVKANGAFNWHRHDDTDDFFLVLEGRLVIDIREASVTLGPGATFVLPQGRAAETRGGKGGVETCRSGWSGYYSKKK